MSGANNIKYDKEKVSFNLARLKTNGEMLEIVVDPDLAVEFKECIKARDDKETPEACEVDIREVLKSEDIFHDASKGQLASEQFLKEVFKTNNTLEIAEKILVDGDIQLTADHRKKIIAAKKSKIINIIHKNAVDPATGLPHPVSRIENALDTVSIKIDEYKRPKDQVENVLRVLRPVLPIKFDVKQIDVKVFKEYAHKAYGSLRKYKVVKESWNQDGSLSMRVEIPAGLRVEFLDDVNSITKGNVEIEILDEK